MIDINEFLKTPKTIAIVGLSDKPDRPSYTVAKYFLSIGFTVIPVNPNISSFLNFQSYPDFTSIPKDIYIDIVNIFRQSNQVLSIIKEVVASGRKPLIWLQEGIFSPESEKLAKQNNLEIISGICMLKAHQRIK